MPTHMMIGLATVLLATTASAADGRSVGSESRLERGAVGEFLLADFPAGCTFATLSAEERKRYQSRYRRRLRTDGQAVADQWLFEQACLTPEERRAARQKPLTGKNGKLCTKTRLEMRVTPGFDGAMTMSPVPVCAD